MSLQVDLKFIEFRNKIKVLNEKLVKNNALKKYFERNCLFELAKKTEAKRNTIKKRKNRLVNREILAYNVSISHLRNKETTEASQRGYQASYKKL
jgi:hypothetical protein